jgi:hypothetical protein
LVPDLPKEFAFSDPTWFSAARSSYQQTLEVLLSEEATTRFPDIPTALLQSFCDTFGPSAYICRYLHCSRSTDGFHSLKLRDTHEATHQRPYRCADPSCHSFHSGFATTRALKKHNNKYHATIKNDESLVAAVKALTLSRPIPSNSMTRRNSTYISLDSIMDPPIFPGEIQSHLQMDCEEKPPLLEGTIRPDQIGAAVRALTLSRPVPSNIVTRTLSRQGSPIIYKSNSIFPGAIQSHLQMEGEKKPPLLEGIIRPDQIGNEIFSLPPQQWLVSALSKISSQYPDDRLEGSMITWPVDEITGMPHSTSLVGQPLPARLKWEFFPKVTCNDCSIIFDISNGEVRGMEKVEIHVRDRQHRKRVEKRIERQHGPKQYKQNGNSLQRDTTSIACRCLLEI